VIVAPEAMAVTILRPCFSDEGRIRGSLAALQRRHVELAPALVPRRELRVDDKRRGRLNIISICSSRSRTRAHRARR
jgi:hypothetical protein